MFQMTPLVEDVEITGPVLVHLWISSRAGDTGSTAKLIDIYSWSARSTPVGPNAHAGGVYWYPSRNLWAALGPTPLDLPAFGLE